MPMTGLTIRKIIQDRRILVRVLEVPVANALATEFAEESTGTITSNQPSEPATTLRQEDAAI